MKNIFFIILFLFIASSIYAGEIDKSSSDNTKSLVVEQERTNSNHLSPELMGAIFGALTAGIVTLLIKFGEWFFNRRELNKVLRIGLYFEVFNHKIIDLAEDQDKQPNFALEYFNDDFYISNLSNLSQVFDQNLIQKLTFYYSHLKLAYNYQNKLIKINEKINKMESDKISDEKAILLTERNLYKDTIRLILATAQFIRNNLKTELKKTFKGDPSKISFIDVLPKHKEWFKNLQKNNDK